MYIIKIDLASAFVRGHYLQFGYKLGYFTLPVSFHDNTAASVDNLDKAFSETLVQCLLHIS